MTAVSVAAETRAVVQRLGGAFMTSAELAEQEAAAGQPANTLYFSGRAAALGAPTPLVAAETFGIFPPRMVELLLSRATLLPEAALAAYCEALWQWSRTHLAHATTPDRTADLLLAVVDAADASGLPLFAGLRAAPRPTEGPERLGHALMLFRELRGGLHFAALRACGVPLPAAVIADPGAGPDRLPLIGWRPEAITGLVATAGAIPNLAVRWEAAEDATNLRTDELLAALDPGDRTELHQALLALE
ncbi:hypothetical protein L6E12_31060 [Actinokineospora sp. PR83]|uniref:SCO6745 family protein n=1 Tax=Actinokineospora sp. PR83 TaxID=2884908 RepID=UPI0027E02E7A|nr:hypothetical protein [Actinokineospora sp. PR83]MCG8920221.1 hypothetical protein [Actinokineospora sp. PR83]